MPKLQHDDHLKIISLFRDGWSPKAIQRKFNDEGQLAGWSTIKDVIKKYQRGDIGYSVPEEQPIPRFNKIYDDDIAVIQAAFSENCRQSSRDIMRRLACRGTNASKSTVKKAIKAAGFTATKPRYCQMIRAPNKEKRVEFCKQLLDTNDNFNDVIWSDECSIQLHDNKVVIYRPTDGLAEMVSQPKHPYKIHVWGGISRRGSTNLLIFDGILKKEFFVEHILKNTLLPFIRSTFPDGHRFQQDNDPKHKSKLAQEFMKDNQINWWNIWPSESCDINPIEMLWNQLKRYLSKRDPTTKASLVQYTQEFWQNELTIETCNVYIDHIFKVVPIVLLMNGRATGDIPRKVFKEPSRGKSIQYFQQQLSTTTMKTKIASFVDDRE